MGSDQFSVWMCVFSLLDLNIGQARFYFLTNVNSLKYVFNFKFLVHKNMFISYDHWYTHQLVKPIDHSKGRLVQVFPWSETLGVLWHKKEKEHLIGINIFLSALLTTCFHTAGLSATRSKKSAYFGRSHVVNTHSTEFNNPFLIICIRG